MKATTILSTLAFILFTTSSWGACSERIKLNKLKDVKVYKCDDGTISYDQPNGKSNYEGLCGPTAAANAFYAYCDNLFVDPQAIASKYFWDITPGVRPDVLTSGLNKMFNNNKECLRGKWKYYYSKDRWSFLNSLYYEVRRGNGKMKRTVSSNGLKAVRSPVLALIKSSGKNLHWVTVVDIVGYIPQKSGQAYKGPECQILYNHYGFQQQMSCADFVIKSHQVDDEWYTNIVLPEYVHLVFEPSK